MVQANGGGGAVRWVPFSFLISVRPFPKWQTCLPWASCPHYFLAQKWQHLGQLPRTRDRSPMLRTAGRTQKPGLLGSRYIRAVPTLPLEAWDTWYGSLRWGRNKLLSYLSCCTVGSSGNISLIWTPTNRPTYLSYLSPCLPFTSLLLWLLCYCTNIAISPASAFPPPGLYSGCFYDWNVPSSHMRMSRECCLVKSL